MNSAELKNKISDLRPNYSDKYRSMIEAISNKQERIGKGNIAQFGPYFQTFMYACVIGLRLGSPKYFEPQEKTWEFAPLFRWKPEPVKDFIIMMLLNRSARFGYSWIDLENADDETITKFLRAFVHEMEGYANRGFEYLAEKWERERVMFSSPTIFVDILLNIKTEAE